MFNFIVTLTYLEDEDNAKQAYEQALKLEERDPSVCLNYAIFLHNKKDDEKSKQVFEQFEARALKYRQTTGTDTDSEVAE